MPTLEHIRALCVDYDRTLTDDDLAPHPLAMDALTRARKAGLRVIVVSGRDAPFLDRKVGHVSDLLVAENGCLIGTPGETARPTSRSDTAWRSRLEALDIEFEVQKLLVSFDTTHYDAVHRTLDGAPVDLIRNRDRTMILPRGVDKASGVRLALDRINIPPASAAAAGDGENDLVMLRLVGHGIAVANAVPELKAAAQHVTKAAGGAGVAEWIDTMWLPSQGVMP